MEYEKIVIIALGIFLFFAFIIFALSVYDYKKRSKVNPCPLCTSAPKFNFAENKKILKKMFFPALLYALMLLWQFAAVMIEGLVLMTILYIFLFAFPLFSFMTTNILFKSCKWRFIWSVIPSFSISLSLFFFTFHPLFVLISFAWCELWSLLGAKR